MNSTNISGVKIDNLYPALTECFVVIICGYIAGRIKIISETEAKGINIFVNKFCLPSMIFMALSRLELDKLNWMFLFSIITAKVIVFALVLIITLVISRSLNYGRAGIFALFCTQSNDFTIGYQIVTALFEKTHPEYISYLVVVAPFSFALLATISFIFINIEHQRRNRNARELAIIFEQECKENGGNLDKKSVIIYIALAVMKSILFNPLIFMSAVGVAGNYIFKRKVPDYLGYVLEALAKAFKGSSLFFLGFTMVGKVQKLRGVALLIPGILIFVKLVVFPLITREVTRLVSPGSNSSDNMDLSTYGFLYATFPTETFVYIIADQFSIETDLIGTALVACIFTSAPLMFVSVKLIAIFNGSTSGYMEQLENFIFDLSIIGIIVSFWVVFVFIIRKQISSVPHKITACLLISQLFCCLGPVLWHTLDKESTWAKYLLFSCFTIGINSTRIWATILAITLLFIKTRTLCVSKLAPCFYFFGWGFPVIITALLLIFDETSSNFFNKVNPNFVYDDISDEIISVILLVFCFMVSFGCLILHQRHIYMRVPREDQRLIYEEENLTTTSMGQTVQNGIIDVYPIEEEINQYEQQILEQIIEELEYDELQILRHTVLMILLLCSMFLGLALSIWSVVKEKTSGVFIELSYLNAIVNFGQSIAVFAIFGLDLFILSISKFCRKIWFGDNLNLLSEHELTTSL